MQTPFHSSVYQGRAESYENELANYYYQFINAYQNQPICLIGFSCDQGVNRNQGRIGAKNAPDVIKNAFGKLPISWRLQKSFDDLDKLIGDKGNIICNDDNVIQDNILETTQNHYAKEITAIIQNNSLPIAIGGGHEIAFGSFMGLYNALNNEQGNNKTIGIINLDAHFDLRNDKYATSGTPFRQIAEFLKDNNETFHYLTIGISEFGNTASLFEKAEKLGVTIIPEKDCTVFSPMTEIQINNFMNKVDVIYITLDLDCLQAGVMPAVSAVNSSGLSLDFVEKTLAHIIKRDKLLNADNPKLKLIDIAEFNPNYDIDGRGAKVAARLLAGMVQNFLLQGKF